MRDRGLAGQDRGTRLDARAQRPYGVEEVKRGAHGALRVVLVRRRHAPHRHDGVTDELLHGPAVSLDDLSGELEVLAQRLADVLRVALLGERRETHEVREQDRHQPPLGFVGRRRGAGWRGRRTPSLCCQRRRAFTAEFGPGGLAVPQFGQARASGEAHSVQNLAVDGFSVWQLAQINGTQGSERVVAGATD